jgi:hypothetical protein
MADTRLSRLYHLIFSALLALILTACGGGGSGPGFIGGGVDGGSGGSTDVLIVATLTDINGDPTLVVEGSDPTTLTALVTTTNGAPLPGEVVTVSAELVALTPASGTQLTDADGIATFQLNSDGSSGAGTAVVSALDGSATVNYSASPSSLTLVLTDVDGAPTTSVSSVSPATLNVTATDLSGQPLASELLTAAVTIGQLLPDAGTALTDLNGEATFRIEAGGTLGAGSVTVSLGDNQETLNYQIGEANLRIGRIDAAGFVEGEIEAGATSLPAAGSTPLTVVVVDADDVPVTTSVAILFASSCASLTPPEAEITAQVNTVNGVATSTYTATGCSGTDTATATIVQGNAQSASVALDVATAGVNSIAFLSASPTLIALKGTGGEGRQESSNVEFQVFDTTGEPVQGFNVDFSLSTTLGGLSLTNAAATTNSSGIARAIVLAGNVSTSVRVTATIDVGGEDRSTVSDRLVVSTGLPDQNSLSLSVDKINVGGGDVDGVTANVTVRMSDKFNNPVPDGTVAFFTTEYGRIDDSCETSGGTCSVVWNSQSPRVPLIYNNFGGDDYISTLDTRTCSSTSPSGTGVPCDTDGTVSGSALVGLGRTLGLRSTIMVSAIGEESFVDANGNGLYDSGEDFQDMGEAFLDNNENRPTGDWLNGFNGDSLCSPNDTTQTGRDCASGLEETFVDFDVNGNYTDGNGKYNGSLCPVTASSSVCSRDLVSVRGDLVITMPSSAGQRMRILNSSNAVINNLILPPGSTTLSVVIADQYNNRPPVGSAVSVSSAACELASGGSYVVGNTNATGAFRAYFTLVGDPANVEPETGLITIKLANSVGDSPFDLEISCTDPTL